LAGATVRATIYLDADLHRALRVRAAVSHRSISDMVNEAVRSALGEASGGTESAVAEAVAPYRIHTEASTVPAGTQGAWHGRSPRGVLKSYGAAPSEADIAEMRREAWGTFGQA